VEKPVDAQAQLIVGPTQRRSKVLGETDGEQFSNRKEVIVFSRKFEMVVQHSLMIS
jgi:hypothetical protein